MATLKTAANSCSSTGTKGIDLRLDYARDTLEHIFRLWTRPVHIKTVVEGKEKLLGYDGENHLERTVSDA